MVICKYTSTVSNVNNVYVPKKDTNNWNCFIDDLLTSLTTQYTCLQTGRGNINGFLE